MYLKIFYYELRGIKEAGGNLSFLVAKQGNIKLINISYSCIVIVNEHTMLKKL